MKFSWKWLKELVDLNGISIEQITKGLTLAGFEVENIEKKIDIQDQTIEISTTSNRSDIFSMIGLAREVSIIFNTKLKKPIYENSYKETKKSDNKNIFKSNILLDLEVTTIQLLEQGHSPHWLKKHLAGCGIKSTNILSDISEYINIKWGQDIEILDLNINDHKINSINIKNTNETIIKNYESIFELLQLETYNKLPYLEIVTSEQSIISILGIKSDSNFHCNDYSKNILVIGQICKPKYIEKLMLDTNYKTSKTKHHLKGISRHDFSKAYNETIELILSLNNGYLKYKNYKYHDSIKAYKDIIIIKDSMINSILGPCITPKNSTISITAIYQTLKQLKLEPQYINGNFIIKIPEYRCMDIQREIDVVEEIIRIYGFDQFMDQIPASEQQGYTPRLSQFIRKTRYILRSLGLHEVLHYSLYNDYSYSIKKIPLYNPLLEDQKELKESLINQLISTAIYNNKQKNLPFECFEIGKIFQKDIKSHKKYKEIINIAGILGNSSFSRKLWEEKEQELTWFQAKGILEDFFEKINTKIYWKHLKKTDYENNTHYKNIYHPYRTAIIYNRDNNIKIGIFGQLNTKVHKLLGASYNHYIFEININELVKTIKYNTHLYYKAKNYSIYPNVVRDISLAVPINESVQSIKQYILNQSNSLIESVKIFNEYQKDSNNRYVGFRITYRSDNRTLNDEDIQQIENEITNLLKTKLQSKS